MPEIFIKFRRALASRWALVNPVLANGEPGYEINTGRLKIGDGFRTWNDLPYFVPGIPGTLSDAPANLIEHVYSEEPHPVYDQGPTLTLLYENAKV